MGDPEESRDGVHLITGGLLQELKAQASERPRGRLNHNFHRQMDEPCHRFLNVLAHDTYVTPHRHLSPAKPESFVVLEGRLLFCLFDGEGGLAEVHRLGPDTDTKGIDIGPGLWHGLIVEGAHAVVFEVKPGPYEPVSDKDFAPWAPQEGEPGAAAYLADLRRRAMSSLEAAAD